MVTLAWIFVILILTGWGTYELRRYIKRADETVETDLIEETDREIDEWTEFLDGVEDDMDKWMEELSEDELRELDNISQAVQREVEAIHQWDQWMEELAGKTDEEMVERLNELGFDIKLGDLPPQDREVMVKKGQVKSEKRKDWIDNHLEEKE